MSRVCVHIYIYICVCAYLQDMSLLLVKFWRLEFCVDFPNLFLDLIILFKIHTCIYRLTLERFARAASGLAETLVEILAENVGVKFTYFQENCPPSSSFLRLNRYPPCPYSSSELVCGLIPHTDTDFLSVVYQDRIGGLQLLKDGRWFGVKPNPEALIINIGDLFQVCKNDWLLKII